jgi:hypothetical protein
LARQNDTMNGKNGRIKERGDYAANAVRRIWEVFDRYPSLSEITLYGLVDPESAETLREMDTYLGGIHFGLASADKQGKHKASISIEKTLVNKRSLRGFDAKVLEETYGAAIDLESDEELIARLSAFLDNHQTGGFLYFGLSDNIMKILRDPKNHDSDCDVELDSAPPYPETDTISSSL